MICPVVFTAVNHVLDNHTELCFSKYFRLNQVAYIEFDKFMNLILVSKDIHDVCLLIICNVTSATSNSYYRGLYLCTHFFETLRQRLLSIDHSQIRFFS